MVGAISYLLVARLSDYQQRRGMYQVIFASTSIVGYGILLSDARAGVKYFGCFVISLGLYITLGIPLAWLPTNQPRYGKRTTATGMQLTIGNCAGIMAPFVGLYSDGINYVDSHTIQLYPTDEGPRYIKGHSVTIAMVAYAACIFGGMSIYFSRINKRRREGKEDYKIAGKTEEEINEMGDESPRFMYTI